MGPVGIAIATRNRKESLRRTLQRLSALPESAAIVVVDNRSSDGTPAMVANEFPQVRLLALNTNRGVAARNIAVAALSTPYVAFSDDDSWWLPGALTTAAETFKRHPGLSLIGARILVGPRRRLDPTCELMAGPAPAGLPGPEIDGFVACGAIVRREQFLAVGGFCERFIVGAEEGLVALDLRARGGYLCYVETVQARHMPNTDPRPDRQWRQTRNELWTVWLRGSPQAVAHETLRYGRRALSDRTSLKAFGAAIGGLGWILRERRAAG